jgi:hypothetical protein
MLTVDGTMLQVVPVGAPLHVRLTGWLKSPRGVKVRVELPEVPLGMVRVVGEAEMVKSGPDPAKEIVCGLVGPLSVMVRVAVRRA